MKPDLEISGLSPHPAETWERGLRFAALSGAEKSAMLATVEALFRAGPTIVADTYNYLQRVPETAAILGWENGFDQAHLQERRRFFTIWLARTISIDFGTDFGLYLFRAGQIHAAHGPRAIHVPETYVTGSMGLVQAALARAIASEGLEAGGVAEALAGWGKYLSVQLNQLIAGYRSARELDTGALAVRLSLFGRLRPAVGRSTLTVHANADGSAREVLRKFFDYAPQVRREALDQSWREVAAERPDALWPEIEPVYQPKVNWRVLLNGRDLRYAGGLCVPVHEGDELSLFPPGR